MEKFKQQSGILLALPSYIIIPIIAQWMQTTDSLIGAIMSAKVTVSSTDREFPQLLPFKITSNGSKMKMFRNGEIILAHLPNYIVPTLLTYTGRDSSPALVDCFRMAVLISPPIPLQVLRVQSTGCAVLYAEIMDIYRRLFEKTKPNVHNLFNLCRESDTKPCVHFLLGSPALTLFWQCVSRYAILLRPGLESMFPYNGIILEYILVYEHSPESRFAEDSVDIADKTDPFMRAEMHFRQKARRIFIATRVDMFMTLLYIADTLAILDTRALFNLPHTAFSALSGVR
jgi:hypothetical protein